MSLPRFFMTIPDMHPRLRPGLSGAISCEKSICHHLVKVLRMRPGEEIELVERGTWAAWRCRLDEVSDSDVRVTVLDALPQTSYPFRTTLLFGYSKGDKNERIVRQATELGVARIMPTVFERSVSRPDEKRTVRKHERLQMVAQSAAEQSHRSDIPDVRTIASFGGALEVLAADKTDLIVVPWEEEAVAALSQALSLDDLPQTPHIALVIGPEGGVSLSEIEALRAMGALTASLGPSILRVDTAVCAALAVVHDLLWARARA